jgi:diguanylate cyclase (GGDEF)-like protein
MTDKIKILIVDDLKENLFALETTLADENLEIIKAESGAQALEYALHHTFAVILLDVMMPHMDGFETAELLRGASRTSITPIIFITGMDNQLKNEFKGYDSGAVDFLYKPFEPRILRSKVAVFVEIALHRQRAEEIQLQLADSLDQERQLRAELENKNKELLAISINDSLTGLYNRRFLTERLGFEFRRAKRYRTPLSCLMLDIDHFKLINDSMGHQFGDLVLVELSKILRAFTRDVDVVGRYGGEEFIIMTNTHVEGAKILAENLLAAVEQHTFSDGTLSRQSTISIGVVGFCDDMRSEDDLISCADAALYEAKETGRNRVVLWDSISARSANDPSYEAMHSFKAKCSFLASQMQSAYLESVSALLNAIDTKDHYTRAHAMQVAYFAVEIGKALNFDHNHLESLRFAAMLQDVGKIGVPVDILVKESSYTDAEFEVMKKHPESSVEILEDIRFLSDELPAILHHHEWWDGSGYPKGLKGEAIPIDARILAIADAYTAILTPRTYALARTGDEALLEIQKHAGTQFDPQLVEVFAEVYKSESQALSERAKRILVADDEREVLDVYKNLLESEGFEVFTADNVLEAVSHITNTSFSLLILDIDMPGMTGLDIINKAHESELNAHTPIIVVTGFGGENIQEECNRLGIQAFFRKPFDIDEILKAVYEAHFPVRPSH